MGSIGKTLKLYRIKTLLMIFPEYWKSSKAISEHSNASSRVGVYLDMLWCLLLYGANDENYLQFEFYGKSHKYRKRFITWRRGYRVMQKSPAFIRNLFLDKVSFNIRFSKYISRKWLDCRAASSEEVAHFIEDCGSVIIKPLDGACGVAVRKLSKEDYGGVLSKIVGGRFILEEVVENVEEIKALNPSSLNTLRIVTMTDNRGGVHVISHVLRVGVGGSITDNAHAGGIAISILGDGTLFNIGRTFKDERFAAHPTTGINFGGYVIPHFRLS